MIYVGYDYYRLKLIHLRVDRQKTSSIMNMNTQNANDLTTGQYTCLLCHSKSAKIDIKNAKDPLTGDFFDIAECQNCFFHQTYPQPSNLNPYYPSSYRNYGKFTSHLLDFLYDLRVKGWLLQMQVKNGSILEIGCGAGFMLRAFNKNGWHVSGIERNVEMASKALANCPTATIYQDLGDISEGINFNLIILFNVLEHINNPKEIIRRCTKHLSANGKIIIVVPNYNSWQRKLFNSDWFHLDPPRHLSHFDYKTLNHLIQETNLQIIDSSFISIEHDPVGWIESSLNKVYTAPNQLSQLLTENSNTSYLHRAVLSLLVSSLIIPSVFFSIISSIFRTGSIMQVIATHQIKSKK